jgi:AcrR family transcriptional regulator
VNADSSEPGRSRSEVTQQALMRAAEKLISERGIESVSIRDIVQEADQKNESALQYHFSNLKGLIAALHASRDLEVRARRRELLAQLLEHTADPSLRDICKLMVAPAFELARAKPDYRRYVKAFGHEITQAEDSALKVINQKGGKSIQQTGLLLREKLSHLDDAAFQLRMDGAVRLIAAAMVHHASQKKAFRGESADFFFHSLLDALVGLLNAPESTETRAFAKPVK